MGLTVHHFTCGSGCPFVAKFAPNWPSRTIAHVLAVEKRDGRIVLIDTGIGREDALDPRRRLGAFVTTMVGLTPERGSTALDALQRIGWSADDVSDVIPTHLDFDHAGGLGDFPDARVHVFEAELHGARSGRTRQDGYRYFAHCWEHDPKWSVVAGGGESWFGFEAVRAVAGAEDDVLLIPLPGHSRGHTGVAVRRGDGWLLHAGDAYYDRREIDAPTGNWLYRMAGRQIHHDPELYWANHERLRELSSEAGVEVINAHDPVHFPSRGDDDQHS